MAKELKHEELLAAQVLEGWLRNKGLSVKWSAVADDPPDLDFVVQTTDSAEVHWAVEVTGLFQYAFHQGKTQNIRYFQSSLDALCRRLSTAVPIGPGVGYALFVSFPMAINWPILEQRAMAYINSGKADLTPLDINGVSMVNDCELPGQAALNFQESEMRDSKVLIRRKAGVGCVTWTVMLDGTAFVPNRNRNQGNGEAKILAEIMSTLSFSLERILQQKLPRMKRIKVKGKYDRTIILIWPGYFFASEDRVCAALQNTTFSMENVSAILYSDLSSSIHVLADPSGLFTFK